MKWKLAKDIFRKVTLIYAGEEKSEITEWCVSKDTLTVFVKEAIVSDEITVAFAQTPYYQVSLYNESGLPAFPFVLQITNNA